MRRPIEDRLWEKVSIPSDVLTGCWLWTAAKNNRGYGVIGADSKKKQLKLAHRVAYELFQGPIPPGLIVLHRCDVPLCVNPAHLRVGTHADNSADCVAKGRFPRGEAYSRGLTEQAVREIRRLIAEGLSNTHIGNMFGVTRAAIREIKCGVNWKHVA